MPETTQAVLTVAGTKVAVTYEMVPIRSIRLNPENPRIRFLRKQQKRKKSDVKGLTEMIKAQPGYDPLQKAIRKANGLHDPIIVSHEGTVVEGNTRTVAITTLHEGAKYDPRWQTVPVMRLPKEVKLKDMAML